MNDSTKGSVEREIDGFILFDKPLGVTSRDGVDLIVRSTGIKRVGHAGTLDPAASGMLIVALGKATRLIEYVQDRVKSYLATVRLDAVSDTDDAEGRVTSINLDSSRVPDRAEIERALANFVGVIMQRPPAYSALKVGGERAYRLARDGREVELEPRPVHIDAIRAIDFRFPLVELEIRCGKGTYVRSIARDLGRSLGLGGMLVALRRTAIGDSHVDDSSVVRPSLELFADAESNDANSFSERSDRRSRRTPGRSKPKLDLNDLVAKLSPLEMATAHLPAVRLDDEQRRMFDQGRRLLFDRVASFAGRTQTAATKRYDVEVRDDRERWIGVGRVMVTALERVDSPGSVAMMLAPHKGGFV